MRYPALLILTLTTSIGFSAEMKKEGIPETVSYYEHVRPVLQAKCQGCHQPAKAKSDYVMTEVPKLIKGGDNGEAVVPNHPEKSYLIELVTKQEGEDRPEMPPKEEPLTDYERQLVTKWVAQGAKDDTPENAKQRYSLENPPQYAVPPVVTSLDYSPDGKLIAVAGFHEVLLHKADGSGLVTRLIGLSERIESVKFSPDGKRLAVAGGLPGRMGEIQVWDLEKKELKLSKIAGYDTAYGASWSPDGKLIAFGLPDNTARAIDANSGEQKLFMGSHSDWVLATDWGTKGEYLVSLGRDMTAKLTEVKTERFVDNLTSITPGALKGGLNAVQTHPTQNHVLIGGSDGVPQIYRMKRETVRKIGDNANLIRKYPAMKGRIWDVAFRPDGKQFAAVSSLNGNGEISLYKSEYDATISPELKKLFETARRSPDADKNREAKIEEFQTKGAEQIAKINVDASAFSVAFSPDGKTIAVGTDDGQIRLLNSADLKEKLAFAPIEIKGQLARREGKANPENNSKGKRHPIKEQLPKGRKVMKIAITPANIDLSAPDAYSQILVTGTLDTGESADLTRLVKFTTDPKITRISDRGIARPVGEGAAKISAAYEGLTAETNLKVSGLKAEFHPDFIRDVNPVISRLGCNMGTCHGAKDGKNGFKLSLRGYDPLYDVRAFGDDHTARRVNYASPDDSLMLLKSTGAVPHEGGVVTEIGSDYYNTLRQWIADGANLKTDTPKVSRIELFPKNPVIQNTGAKQQLRVIAYWADGKSRDVTQESFIESGNSEVAEHDSFGLMATIRRGEAPILARYEGAYAATTMTVMGDREGFTWKQPETWGKIDELVAAKWERMKIEPSGLCNDEQFVRRVHLDLIGLPPRSEKVKSFLADKRPTREKRDALVDELIGSPSFVDHWTNKWSDMLQVNSKFLGGAGATSFRDWIKKEIAANTPYDDFAYKILTASGSNKDNPAASYYKILRGPTEIMENTTHLFLATRFNCNKCHDHPFERWTQDQYYETAAYFARTGLDRDTKNAPTQNIGGSAVEGAKPLYEIVKDNPEGELKHERTGEIQVPVFPFEAPLAKVAFTDPKKPTRREELAAWITSPKNEFFASSYANRIWGYMLGTGVIMPLDDIRAGNPPSNPVLLDYLASQFIKSDFNAHKLFAEICKSRTYQLSIETNKWNETDEINFSHGLARRLPAEVLYDSVYFVTGATPNIPGTAPGVRASQLSDAKLDLKSGFLANLGRPVRESACECERNADMQMSAVMAFLSGPAIADAISAENSELAKLVDTLPDNKKLIEEIYYRVLSRSPKPAETEAALGLIAEIESDHKVLTARLSKSEADWVPLKSDREISRFQKINKAESVLAAYMPEANAKKAKAAADQKARIAAAAKAIADYNAALPAKVTEWEKGLKLEQFWTRWHPLIPTTAVADAKSSLKLAIEKDNSIIATGPTKAVNYTITIPVKNAAELSGFMIEALPDERLEGYGPGVTANGNFVVSEFDVSFVPTGGDAKKPMELVFNDAVSNFIQGGFNVKAAYDGKKDRGVKGWAVGGNERKPNRARFKLDKPLAVDAKGGTITVTIYCQYGGGEYPLGKFRLWTTSSPTPLDLGLPGHIATLLQTSPAARTDGQKSVAGQFYRERADDYHALVFKHHTEKKPLPGDTKLAGLQAAVKTAQNPIQEDPHVLQLRQDMSFSTKQAANRRLTAAQDLAWALINNPSFLFNR